MRPAAAAGGRLTGPAGSGMLAGRWPGSPAGALTGSADEVRAEIEQAAQAGVTHVICQFEHATQDELMASIECFAQEIMSRS